MVSAFACIICHVISGARKEETISRWTRDRVARETQGTETLSVLGVSRVRCGCPGARRTTKASISADWGTATSPKESHSGCTNTVAGMRQNMMSLTKAGTFPSSGVGCVKDKVTT